MIGDISVKAFITERMKLGITILAIDIAEDVEQWLVFRCRLIRDQGALCGDNSLLTRRPLETMNRR
jgi:hypothetical protein